MNSIRHLTTLEQNALRVIVLEYKLDEDTTKVWEDIITGNKVTIDDLLTLTNKPMGVYNAFEEGQIEESRIREYQGDDGIWPSTETSSSSISRNSEEIRKEEEIL
ncbi:MAG TPA: hypothetical protein VII99_10725 [Bacteroidia bacterium]